MIWVLALTLLAIVGCDRRLRTDEIVAAQSAWASGVVEIGSHYIAGHDYRRTAATFVDRMYAYNTTEVFFKPTMAAETSSHEHHEFRLSRPGAISYMVGGDSAFPEDLGFALKPWASVEFRNGGITTHGDVAMAMGDYYFTDTRGFETKVEYSFGYVRCNETGWPRIVLHHSSLPYQAPESTDIRRLESTDLPKMPLCMFSMIFPTAVVVLVGGFASVTLWAEQTARRRSGFVLQTSKGLQSVFEVVTDPDNWRSGITVALLSVPFSIAAGIGSGTTPYRGLAAAVIGGIGASVFGSSDYNIVGPAGALSVMLTEHSVKWTDDVHPWISLFSACFILLILLLRLHRHVALVPPPVFHGFTLAVATVIGLNQLNFALGVAPSSKHASLVANVLETVGAFGGLRVSSLFAFVAQVILLRQLRNLYPKLPWVVIVPVLSIPIGWLFHTSSTGSGLWTLKTKYADLTPQLVCPLRPISSLVALSDIIAVLYRSGSIAIVAVLETLTVAKIAADRTNREFNDAGEVRGLAVAHALCGAAGAMPPSAVFVRTALNESSGATHRFSQLLNAVTVGMISLFLMPVFLYLPQATVASIQAMAALNMVPAEYMRQLRKSKGGGLTIALLTAGVSVIVDPLFGLLIGIFMHHSSWWQKWCRSHGYQGRVLAE